VRDERRLHFHRRDVDAAHLEHVVGAPAVGVVAVLVEAVLVAASRPRPLEGVLGLLALVPVHERGGRPADLQLAKLPGLRDEPALFIEQAHFIARRFEMKMCSISVEPMPSRISAPVFSVQRSPRLAGSASPAEVQILNLRSSRLGKAGWARSAAYSVGTP
jgi:hypothetical protein